MKNELKKILDNLNGEEIKDFLLEILLQNKEILDEFRRQNMDLFPKISKDEYKIKIHNDIRRCLNKEGYIGEEESFDFSHEIYKYKYEAEELVAKEEVELAVDILLILLKLIPEFEPDDSFGNINDACEDCIELLKSILEESIKNKNIPIVEKIFFSIRNEIETKELSNYSVDLYLLANIFIDKNLYLEEIKKTLSKELEENSTSWMKKSYEKLLNRIDKI